MQFAGVKLQSAGDCLGFKTVQSSVTLMFYDIVIARLNCSDKTRLPGGRFCAWQDNSF